MMICILSCPGANVNSLTSTGRTALDVVADMNAATSIDQISNILLEAGAKRSRELDRVHDERPPNAPIGSYIFDIQECSDFGETTNRSEGSIASETVEELYRAYFTMTPRLLTEESYPLRRHNEFYEKEIRNSRNTLAIAAVLIATVSFAAGIAPPGGVHQDGPLAGKAVLRRTFFQLFMVTNGLALFTSLGIMVSLVIWVPTQYMLLLRQLTLNGLAMWVSVVLMSVAYVAATLLLVEEEWKTRWVPLALSILGIVIIMRSTRASIILSRVKKEVKRQFTKKAN